MILSRRCTTKTISIAMSFLVAMFAYQPDARSAPPEEIAYQNIDKGLYVWNPGGPWWEWSQTQNAERLVGFCKAHGFRKAILFVGSVQWEWESDFSKGNLPHESEFVLVGKQLRDAGIEPHAAFYLNDAPGNLENYQRAADVVQTIDNFNKKYPGSAWFGLDGDQEPGTADTSYLAMNQEMLARKQQLSSAFPIGAALRPKWLNQPSVTTWQSNFSDALASLDTGMLMAYQNNESGSTSWGDMGLSFAKEVNRSLSIAIETADLGGTNADSFYQMVIGNKSQFFQMVVTMNNHYLPSANYHGFVIHDYANYFQDLYGVKPNVSPSTTFPTLYTGGETITPRSWTPIPPGSIGSGGTGGAGGMSGTGGTGGTAGSAGGMSGSAGMMAGNSGAGGSGTAGTAGSAGTSANGSGTGATAGMSGTAGTVSHGGNPSSSGNGGANPSNPATDTASNESGCSLSPRDQKLPTTFAWWLALALVVPIVRRKRFVGLRYGSFGKRNSTES
jgi:hypothetical protein